MRDRLNRFVAVVIAAAMILNALAARAELLCIGADHLGLHTAREHQCCQHGDEGPRPGGDLRGLHEECSCIDIALPDVCPQSKRTEIPAALAPPPACNGIVTIDSARMRADIVASPPWLDRHKLRTVVLLI